MVGLFFVTRDDGEKTVAAAVGRWGERRQSLGDVEAQRAAHFMSQRYSALIFFRLSLYIHDGTYTSRNDIVSPSFLFPALDKTMSFRIWGFSPGR